VPVSAILIKNWTVEQTRAQGAQFKDLAAEAPERIRGNYTDLRRRARRRPHCASRQRIARLSAASIKY
jgi:hypothetical protein